MMQTPVRVAVRAGLAEVENEVGVTEDRDDPPNAVVADVAHAAGGVRMFLSGESGLKLVALGSSFPW